MEVKTSSERVRYYLASAGFRFLSRLIDLVILFAIVFALMCIIFFSCNSKLNLTDINTYESLPAWSYFLLSLISSVIIFVYFTYLPTLTNGRTIGNFLTKTMIVNMHISRKFIFSMIRRESLLSILFAVISLCLGITFISMGDAKSFELLKEFINVSGEKQYDTIVKFFEALYSASGILLFVFLLWMIVKNKRRCLQDIMSDTVTIKTNSKSNTPSSKTNIKTSAGTSNYGLPAEVESIDLGELDKY